MSTHLYADGSAKNQFLTVSLGTLLLLAGYKTLFIHISLLKSTENAINLAYLGMVCSVCIKPLRKRDKWRTKEEMGGSTISTVEEPYRKDLSQYLMNAFEHSDDRQSLSRNDLSGSVAVKNPFFKKVNWEKRLRCAKVQAGLKIRGNGPYK